MFTVRCLASPMDLAVIPAEDEPLPSAEDCVAHGAVALGAYTEEGALAGGLLLLPAKQVADHVLAYKLAWLYVRPECRRGGAARALLIKASASAEARGANRIGVCIKPTNDTGNALFEALGPVPGAVYVLDLSPRGL